ncbi:MucBP domain-containing protein [Levilactobacillus yiduensis]|uniref:MucBP domain-containing protein n=1 Tax=Levilactobacillus yiduensis TaxID=2953880 RepID=UPI000EF2A8CD|nr:MucBP domain-containing protein [Levilactobacillus yiduensis]AYM03499.1 LPXTG cell wall anchor domain-containing protein [Levilactobacillus brevis]
MTSAKAATGDDTDTTPAQDATPLAQKTAVRPANSVVLANGKSAEDDAPISQPDTSKQPVDPDSDKDQQSADPESASTTGNALPEKPTAPKQAAKDLVRSNVPADDAAPTATDETQSGSPVNDTTTQTDYASATPIAENPKAVTPDGTQKLAGKYAFIPKFNGSGTTAVSVIGTEKSVTKKNTIAADLATATKGAVGFKYTNVGFDAEGHSMDMNILYTDWGRLSETDPAYVETYTTMIYSNFRGAGWGDVKYQFVRSDSGAAENVTGLLTLTDIDGNQTVSITDSQWANIDNVYIPEGPDPLSGQTDNWLRYTENNGYLTLVSPDSGNTPSDGKYSMLTFTYTNQSALTFRYSDGLDGSVPTKMTAWGVNYIPQKPLATATVTPTVTVSDSDETTVLRDTVKDGESTYTYNLNQVIPDEWAQFYYGSVTLTGTLPQNTTITGFKVLDEVGNDVTQYFTNASSGQAFKATVNADALQNSAFYGHRYTLQLTMNVPQTDQVQQLNFQVATTIDGDTQASNSVTTMVDKKHYLVTHYYIQGTTTPVAPDQRQRLIYGTSYTTSALTLDNYRLVGQVRTSGTFTDENQPAIYEYAPLTVTIPVKFVDQRGKEISPATSLTGRLTTQYDANSLKRTLTGYDLKSVEHVTGTYVANPTAIIFHYQAKTITIKIRDIDNYDNDLDKELGLKRTIQGLYNDPYQLSVLDVPQWSEIYSGAKSLLTGTYAENRTITLRYKQAWNQNYDNYDGSQTIPVFNGLDKLIGVMQVHPGNREETTTVLIKPNGKYLVGTLDDDIDVDTFHQQATVLKGKSVTITSNTGEKIKVSISKNGAITIAHLNSKTLPVADRAIVSANGREVKQYIDTKSAVTGLRSSALSVNGEYGFRQAIQEWPNGYTTIYDSSNPNQVKITVKNVKGKQVYNKHNFKLTKNATIKVGNNRWIFKSNVYGALNAQLIVANKAGNGQSYVQQLTFGGTLKWTSLGVIKQHQLISLTTKTYGQYREQYYDDEPEASSAMSGHVTGTQKVTYLGNNRWQVIDYNRSGKQSDKITYHLHEGNRIPADFVTLSATQQRDWLAAHSDNVKAVQGSRSLVDSHVANSAINLAVSEKRTAAGKTEEDLPQTGESQSLVGVILGLIGVMFGSVLAIVKKRDEENDD